MFFIGLLFVLAICIASIGGGAVLFVSPASAMVTFGIPIFLILSTYSGKGVGLLFRLFFTLNVDEEDLKLGLNIYKDTKLYLIVAGWIGVLIGGVLMGANLEDINELGPGLAMCILTIFYGYLFAYFVCHPVIRRIEEKLG